MSTPRSNLLQLLGAASFLSSAAIAAPFAYITNSGDNTVSVIDTGLATVVATVPVGRNPFAVAIHPSGRRVYITNLDDHTVSVIDPDLKSVEATIAGGAYGIAVTPDGAYALAADVVPDPNAPIGGAVFVAVIDTSTNMVIDRIRVDDLGTGDGYLQIAVNPTGQSAYLFTTLDSEMYPCQASSSACRLIYHRIDVHSRQVADRRTFLERIGGRAKGIAFDGSNNLIYVAQDAPDGFAIAAIPQSNPSLEARFGVSATSLAVDSSRSRLYASTPVGVIVLDLVLGTEVTTIEAGFSAGVALNPPATRLYVARPQNNSVAVIDTSTLAIVDSIPVGRAPVAFGNFIAPAVSAGTPTPTVTAAPRDAGAPTSGGGCSIGKDQTVECRWEFALLFALTIPLWTRRCRAAG